MSSVRINLDANASYGVLPDLLDEAVSLCRGALNPSSVHIGGQLARALIEEARDKVGAALEIGATARVVFTSGATEANNMAIMMPFWSELECQTKRGSLVVSAIEHPSVLEVAQRLESLGVSVHRVYASSGRAALVASLVAAISQDTRLVSVMLANNETGEILPLREIAQAARRANPEICVHSDAVQAFGKIPCVWDECAVDALSLSGHKIGALAGTGALVISKDIVAAPLVCGGPQEFRLRAGTENLLGIVSFGLAAERAKRELSVRVERMRACVVCIERTLATSGIEYSVNTAGRAALPNTLNVRLHGVRADDLVVALDLEGILVSSGAACSSGKPEPSHVLLAMGASEAAAKQSIRISVRADLTEEDARAAAEKIVASAKRCRSEL